MLTTRCVENHLVVPPESLKEIPGGVTVPRLLGDLADGALPVDGVEQLFLLPVDRQIKVCANMVLVNKHTRGPGWEPFFNADRVRYA